MSGRFDRVVEGKLTINGVTTEFALTIDGYSQWGADTGTLGDRVDYLQAMVSAIAYAGFFDGMDER